MTHPLEVEGKIDRCGERSQAAADVLWTNSWRGGIFGCSPFRSEPERRFRSSPNNRFSESSQASVSGYKKAENAI